MSVPNSPIVNAGHLYLDGLELAYLVIPSVPVSSYVAGKAFLMLPGQARDSTNINDIILPQASDAAGQPYVLNDYPVGAVVNGLQVGANGVDVAVLAASSAYAVYVIGSSISVFTSSSALGGGPSPNPLGPISASPPVNPYPVAGLLSLASNEVPSLPSGYDMYRRVGTAMTDAGALVIDLIAFGENRDLAFSNAPVRVLTAGAAVAFAAVPVAVGIAPDAGVPAVYGAAKEVVLSVSYTSALAANTAEFLPFGSPGSAGSVGVVSFGGSVAGVQTGVVSVPVGYNAGVPTIMYKVVAGDTLTLSVVGFH